MHTVPLRPNLSLPLSENRGTSKAAIMAADRRSLQSRAMPVIDTVNTSVLHTASASDKHGLDPQNIVRNRMASEVAQLALIAGGLTTGKNSLSPDNITINLAQEISEANTMTVMSEAGSKLVIATFIGFGASVLTGPYATEGIEMPTGEEQKIVKGLAEHQEVLNQNHNFDRPPFDLEDYQNAYRNLIDQNQ